MDLLVNSPYGKSSMLSLFVHSLLIAALIAMPPAVPAEREKNLAVVEILPTPPVPEQTITPPRQDTRPDSAPRPEAQNQPAEQPSLDAEPAPQAEALPGEASTPTSVGLRSGTGTGIPRMTGIPPVRGSRAGGGSAAASASAVYAPKPAYPPAARKDGWEGSVVVQIRVNADGSVTVLSVLESARDDVKEAAVAAAAARQYSPERDANGIPVSVVRNIMINFDLTDS